MREYLAKSDPRESVEAHTAKVLAHCEAFLAIYGARFSDAEKDALRLVCRVHDLGKRNPAFQEKIRKNMKKVPGEIPHGILSCAYLNKDDLEREFGADLTEVIFQAVYNHHRRKSDATPAEITDYIREKLLPYVRDDFPIDEKNRRNHNRGKLGEGARKSSDGFFTQYFRIKGLLNKFDYAASAADAVTANAAEPLGAEYPPENPSGAVIAYLKSELGADINECQRYMRDNSEKNIIVIASTGSGKSEGALLWAGLAKTFYTLPLKVSIDAMFERFNGRYYPKGRLGHLHSGTLDFLTRDDASSAEDAKLFARRARCSVFPAQISTLDQLFTFVFKAPGLEILAASLSYSKLIIDEIQAYSPEIIAYIIYGLKLVTAAGGKFCIMTATLPPFITDAMKDEKIEFEEPRFFPSKLRRHKIKILDGAEFDYAAVTRAAETKKVLVICNTVKRAQEVFGRLKESGARPRLLHGRFIKSDRKIKEDAIRFLGKRTTPGAGLFVSTQIVEASLDIDFDELHTEMCSADSLLQRMGRCYRSRDYGGEEPNVYIADSGTGKGEKSVYNPKIYDFSLESLRPFDGKLFTEDEKRKYIDEVYETERFKSTGLYEKFKKRLDALKNLPLGEYEKNEAKRKFRDILAVKVIPRAFGEEAKKFAGADLEKYLEENSVSIPRSSVEACNKSPETRGGLDLRRVGDTDYFYSNFDYDAETGLTTPTDDEVQNIL